MMVRLFEKLAPERTKIEKDRLDHEAEVESRKADLAEREVVALEQIGMSLAIIKTRQDDIDKNITDWKSAQDRHLSLLSTSLVTANQSLAVILDRVGRFNASTVNINTGTSASPTDQPQQEK